MNLIPRPREPEAFDRALRDGAADGTYAEELSLATTLRSQDDVRPGAAFSAGLRAALLEAAAAMPPAASPRRRRRWTLAAPAAVLAIASGGVAYAVTALTPGSTPPIAAKAPVASSGSSELSSVRDQLATVSYQLRAGTMTAAALQRFRTQVVVLQRTLLTEYRSGLDPKAMARLQRFAEGAATQLAALRSKVPTGLESLYLATIQTLIDAATEARSACIGCGLPAVVVPSPVATTVKVHAASLPPLTPPHGSTSASSAPVVTPPKVTTPATPPVVVPPPSGQPTVPPPGVPSLTVPNLTSPLPSGIAVVPLP